MCMVVTCECNIGKLDLCNVMAVNKRVKIHSTVMQFCIGVLTDHFQYVMYILLNVYFVMAPSDKKC